MIWQSSLRSPSARHSEKIPGGWGYRGTVSKVQFNQLVNSWAMVYAVVLRLRPSFALGDISCEIWGGWGEGACHPPAPSPPWSLPSSLSKPPPFGVPSRLFAAAAASAAIAVERFGLFCGLVQETRSNRHNAGGAASASGQGRVAGGEWPMV